MTPEEIETALGTMDWEHIFSDDPPRKDRSFRRKRDDDLYLVDAKPGISDEGELKFPTGAIQGQKFNLALRELTLPVSTVTDFDRLYIPFRAVASDIGNGKAVVLGKGDLATAMRASMSVPGAFAATDIVIAVDISSPYAPAEEVNNLFSITVQLTSIMTRTNADRQIATLTDHDFLIVPDLGDITSSDFDRYAGAILTGRKAAEGQHDKLARLGLSGDAYREYVAVRTPRPAAGPPIVHFVHIENDSKIDDGMIRDRLHQATGVPLDIAQLEQDISTIYGLELFQTVGYDVIEEDGRTGLLVTANARSWGPNYLQAGMELSSDIDGDNSYNLGLAYLRTAINPLGGEIRLAAQVGEEPLIGGDWHQPLDTLSRYFVAAGARYGARNVDIFDGSGDRLAEFRVKEAKLELAAGREFSVYGEGRLGYRYRSGEVDLRTGTPGLPEFHFDTGEVFGRLSVDRLDNYNFPADGWLASLEYDVAREDLGGDADFDQLQLRGNNFTTFANGHVVGIGGSLSTTQSGTAAIQDVYRLGGFLNLSGYVQDSLSGQQAGMLVATYYRRHEPLPFLSWYVGGSLEYGGVWQDKDDIFSDAIAAGSLFLGADTPIGPFYLGYGHAEGGNNTVFFYLGRPQFQ
jgi:NTE family protein